MTGFVDVLCVTPSLTRDKNLWYFIFTSCNQFLTPNEFSIFLTEERITDNYTFSICHIFQESPLPTSGLSRGILANKKQLFGISDRPHEMFFFTPFFLFE